MPKDTIIFHDRTRDLALLSPTFPMLHLLLPEFEVAIRLNPLIQQAVLGRSDPLTRWYPDIDLAQYRAHEKGVSRQHAALRLAEHEMQVMDLGGVNGTYLNGKRLTPYQRYAVHEGDELMLGKLVLRVQRAATGTG